MPIYDYHCDHCGHQQEHMQKVNAPLIAECPICHNTNYHKIISGRASFVLKGDGWYETDFKTEQSPSTTGGGCSGQGGGCACH